MFCNQCGKDNRDGTKFCMHCGAPMRTSQSNTDNVIKTPNRAEVSANQFMTAGVKSLLTIILTVVLLIIAAVNIIKVQFGVLNIPVKNELQQANRLSDICETNSYIYFASDALYRMDKTSNTITKVSNKSIYPYVATSNGIYGFDDSGNCYMASDKSGDVEKVDGIKRGLADNIFISGRYNYVVSINGTITKKLNSDKYGGYSVILYNGDSGETLIKAKMYKDYIYMILSGSSSYSDRRFIRVSLKTGKEEELTDNSIAGFSFAENQIVCNDTSGDFFVMNLGGGNEQEYTEIKSVNNASFICANGYVYYVDYSKLYRFGISGGDAEELGKSTYGLTEINGGFAKTSGDELTLIDYDGNEIFTAEP